MSTEIYPPSTVTDAEVEESKRKESTWYIKEIMIPELPNVVDTLEMLLKLLQDRTEFKLPLTSNHNENIKGVVVRSGDLITKLDFMLKLDGIKVHRMTLAEGEVVKLPQLTMCSEWLQEAMQLLQELDQVDEAHVLEHLQQVMQKLTLTNSLLQHPRVTFPISENNLPQFINGQLADTKHHLLHIDYAIVKSELCIECKSLEKVTTEPWCKINNGKSFADEMRERMKTDRTLTVNSLSLPFSLWSHRSPTEYLTKCVTYHDQVVMEVDKVIARCSDPYLLSISTKLDGLEHAVGLLYTNLSMLYD